ncbi:MAG: F0F1 ATP synthase subunit A [Caldilineaceae bacterium]|jgi:F-type H+-transporting ATPase subunit a
MEPLQQDGQGTSQVAVADSEMSTSDEDTNIFVALWNDITNWVQNHPRSAASWGGVVLLLIMGVVANYLVPGLAVAPPHVALSGQPLVPGGWITNSLLTTLIVDIVIIVLALLATIGMKEVPGRWQSFVEMVLEYLYGMSESVAGRDARKYFPWVVTIFIFVIVSNWVDVLPGIGSIIIHQEAVPEEHAASYNNQLAMSDGKLVLVDAEAAEEGHGKEVSLFRPPTADLNTTFALALITMVMVQVWGISALGLGYFRKFFQFKGPNIGMKLISAFVGILELLSEFSRLIAFGFRLFGNIFAGEIVLMTMAFLIAYVLPVPFFILEVFVGFVQALVFMMLALVFFSMATMSHEHDH